MLHEQLEDYSNEYLAALIRYAQGIIDERESLIPAASISPRHEDRWWDSDNAKWVYPSEDDND